GPQRRGLDRVYGPVSTAGIEAPLRVHAVRGRPHARASAWRVPVARDRGTHRRSRPGERDAGRRLLALSPQLARERSAADDPLSVVAHTLPQFPVGGDDPKRRLELRNLACDAVVGGLPSFPDDDDLVTVRVAPCARELFELVLRDVRPHRTADVLPIDEDGGHAVE